MSKKKRRKNKTAGDVILTLLLLVAVGVFCFAGYKLFSIYMQYKKVDDTYNEIAQMAVTERDPDAMPPAEGNPDGETLVPPMKIDFDALKAANDDVIGWIYVEALDNVNYPIVRGIDNDYYLHRDYRKNYSFAGTIFNDFQNSDDFNDCYDLIYGHNMNNGSMFGQLKKFVNNPAVYQKSKYYWIFTPDYSYRYEIIAAYNAPVKSDTYQIYKGPGEEFEKFLSHIPGYSKLPEKPEDLNVRDKIMCLSTCTGTGDYSERFVVLGRRVNTVINQ